MVMVMVMVMMQSTLTGILNEMLSFKIRRSRFSSIEEVGVVGGLAQLHEDVQKTHTRTRLRCDSYDPASVCVCVCVCVCSYY